MSRSLSLIRTVAKSRDPDSSGFLPVWAAQPDWFKYHTFQG
jgi:hypothetical protein